MATNGTPFEGRDNVIVPALYQALTDSASLQLFLYTNAADSLDSTTILSNLVDPSGTGYSRKTLGGVWSGSNGIVTYDDGTPDDIIFENTGGGDWTPDITGAAILSSIYLLHFKDFALGSITMTPGKQIRIDLSTLIS